MSTSTSTAGKSGSRKAPAVRAAEILDGACELATERASPPSRSGPSPPERA